MSRQSGNDFVSCSTHIKFDFVPCLSTLTLSSACDWWKWKSQDCNYWSDWYRLRRWKNSWCGIRFQLSIKVRHRFLCTEQLTYENADSAEMNHHGMRKHNSYLINNAYVISKLSGQPNNFHEDSWYTEKERTPYNAVVDVIRNWLTRTEAITDWFLSSRIGVKRQTSAPSSPLTTILESILPIIKS